MTLWPPSGCLAVPGRSPWRAAWCSTRSPASLRQHPPQVHLAQDPHPRAAEAERPRNEVAIQEGPRLQGAAWPKAPRRLRPKFKFRRVRSDPNSPGRKSGISSTGKLKDGLEVGEADIWRKNVLPPPTVTGKRRLDLPLPGQNDCHYRGEKAEGLKAGEGRGRFPATASAASASFWGDHPLAGCRTHIVNGAGGRVGGPLWWQRLGSRLLSGGDSGVFSPMRPLLAFRRRRRRRQARPGSPECTARRVAPPVGEKRKV